jgi:KRAB domain-containing zinc finger protein
MSIHKAPTVKCDKCGQELKNRDTLRNHMLNVHQSIKNCRICGKGFKHQKFLDKHEKIHSTEIVSKCGKAKRNNLPNREPVKKLKCGVCGKGFTNKLNLEKHKTIHRNCQKKYKCNKCGKRFRRSDTLTEHFQTHNVGKKFKCQTCGKAYQTKRGLRRHQEVEMGGIQRNFECFQCKKRFNRKDTWINQNTCIV